MVLRIALQSSLVGRYLPVDGHGFLGKSWLENIPVTGVKTNIV